MNKACGGKRVAVVGGGVAGITAAYLLQQRHEVTLFEKSGSLGGHTRTCVLATGPDAGTPVDTGFIVFNNRTYPNFMRLLERLGVACQPSEMSFSCYNESSGLAYAGTGLSGLFARRLTLLSPSYWRFIAGILRFSRRTRELHLQDRLGSLTLGAFCERERLPQSVIDDYVLPMASAIWSSPFSGIRDFPMASIARFYENHGLLSLNDRPTWYTVRGGSHTYVNSFLKTFAGAVRTGCAVKRVTRNEGGALLAEPTPDERGLLAAWSYSRNQTVLHTDERLMPPVRRAWASWNYLRLAGATAESPACLTYYMNRLQDFQGHADYLVTLNPLHPVRREALIAEFQDTHPVYTAVAVGTQARLPELNGRQHTYFCGSYFNNGFHEDAVTAAVNVATLFGCTL
ncbi:FAD-dependent oxidoreductase [bacterium]|nr:FAD-dependent oxidoreductase [bacterium]